MSLFGIFRKHDDSEERARLASVVEGRKNVEAASAAFQNKMARLNDSLDTTLSNFMRETRELRK